MIIGEQRLSENNYYGETSNQLDGLKRKINTENESRNVNNSYSGRPGIFKNFSSNKMHFVESLTAETYSTYQNSDQIHQDGDQSYINLTVLTPTLIQYDKVTIGCRPEEESEHFNQINITKFQENNEISLKSKPKDEKYEVKNYQQSDNLEDNEDKNLSWLFNFKLDEIANLSPEIKRKRSSHQHHQNHQVENHNHSYYQNNNSNNSTLQQNQNDENNIQRTLKDPCIEDDLNVAENIIICNTPPTFTLHTPKKPPFTYTELIEYALEDKGELTVSGIYQWISDRFPYYKSNDDRWKNSVRHNLSINPHFRKGNKAKAGAGHLWKISSRESEANFLAWEHKKQRLDLFFKMEAANQLKVQNSLHRKVDDETNLNKHSEYVCSQNYDAELNAATASIIKLPLETCSPIIAKYVDTDSPVSSQYYQFQEILPTSQHQQTDELRKTAGEILNGVRRNVEVQIMHPSDLQSYSILNTEDYLNPISKEEIMQESGLGRRHDEFYLIDPTIVNGSEEPTEVFEIFHEDFNLNYFGNNMIA
ncbi:unnamed protein product [Chironomus riparius]|uniref:Fork-head domain-containing protein n=1 Tax=Chironomus riparius TaxID=315576 RepID=A0A9N9WPN3_9DIPT|nr:unnamed protein product [Chironomus riparius]